MQLARRTDYEPLFMQLARRRLEQLVHVLPESIKQRKLHLHILLEQLNLARGHRCVMLNRKDTRLSLYRSGSHCDRSFMV